MSQDFGVNQGLVEEQYLKYRDNPASVSDVWRRYFDNLDDEPLPPRRSVAGHVAAVSVPTAQGHTPSPSPSSSSSTSTGRSFAPGPDTRVATELQSRVSAMVNAYRVRGHLFANLDPLGILPRRGAKRPPNELDLAAFGLSDVDLDTSFNAMAQTLTLREIVARLEATYCQSIGVEVTQLEDNEERDWLQTAMETTLNKVTLSREQRMHLLEKLTEAEVWETFVHKAYVNKKRFSLEGGESTVPMMDLIIERAAEMGLEEVVIGMAHRGRLNMLLNVMELPARDMLAAFEDSAPEKLMGRGDVKYHLGYSSDRTFAGKSVHLTMSFNPSHLEFVNPVVTGRVRAKQDRRGDTKRERVLPLLIHGDAAFIGQGIVAETLNLAYLQGYSTGGTIHIVINNQLGYTTVADDARSTQYCTDLVRMLRCPVFHVNGDDPDAVAQVAILAAEYRQRFHKDAVIDLYCYRKYGHNEADEPRFTQPTMYKSIDAKETVRKIYATQLATTGFLSESESDALVARKRKALEDALQEVRDTKRVFEVSAFGGLWQNFRGGADLSVADAATGVDEALLRKLLETMRTLPEGFQVRRQISDGVLKNITDALEQGKVKWGTAENLAYATLLASGNTVRVTGQDCRRGTFAHRQAVLHDSATGAQHTPLLGIGEALQKPQGRFDIYDSPLSEQGCLGFEWGYSLDCPDGLVVWEAQFGDFGNGAQVIIDQFIASSEDKWHRLSGLVMLLPHGYEGSGPEHSSARLERFLALSAEDNIQVVNLTSAAQIFHALRRQVVRQWRKPLIVMSPKSLFRSPNSESQLSEFVNGSFQRIIPDKDIAPKKAKRVLLCTGKVYFDLVDQRKKENRDDVAIIRIEQLYPLRTEELREVLAPYADGTDLVWVQEEPFNSGAWFFMNARLPGMIGDRFGLRVISRDESASPATGSEKAHKMEQEQLLHEAFAPAVAKSARPSARPRAAN